MEVEAKWNPNPAPEPNLARKRRQTHSRATRRERGAQLEQGLLLEYHHLLLLSFQVITVLPPKPPQLLSVKPGDNVTATLPCLSCRGWLQPGSEHLKPAACLCRLELIQGNELVWKSGGLEMHLELKGISWAWVY